MSTRFRGLPVFCLDDERAVGSIEGRLVSLGRGEELLVRSGGPTNPVVRRVAGSDVACAGSTGVLLNLDLAGFLSQPQHLPDEEHELATDP
jgi:hypothetical protein